jgi:hypothetical protein
MASGFKAFDIPRFRAGVVAWEREVEGAVEEAVHETVQEGAKLMQDYILEATTKTGEDREAHGRGVAGRYETGNMYRDVEAEVTRESDTIVGRWGWIRNSKDYYEYQEYGTRFIQGMNALGGSFIRAYDALKGRLRRITR